VSCIARAGIAEDRLDPAARAAHRVQAARLLAAAGLRDVDASRSELAFEFEAVEFRLAGLESGADLVADRVDARARGLAFVRGQGAQRFQLRGDRAFLAEQFDLERLEIHEARARRDPHPGVCRQGV
jgi:hypothetical protein